MRNNIFECKGFKGNVQFRFADNFIFITARPEKDEVAISENDLIYIGYANYPWLSQGCITNIELNFIYNSDGKQKAKSIILNTPGKDVTELLDSLKERYPERCLIGPTEKERMDILAPDFATSYKLHSLNILTPLGVISGFLLIFAFVLYVMLATTDQAIMTNPEKMSQAGIIILILSLIPLSAMYLIDKKWFMVVQTDRLGITVRKFLRKKHHFWKSFVVKAPKPGVHNVYVGLYCEASNSGEVAAARALVNINLAVEGKKDTVLLMSADEAGRFYRGLYYRNKISLDQAMQFRAFL